MAYRFARSAARHGIARARAAHVIANCPDPIYEITESPDEPDRVLFLGPDQDGVPLEVIAVELDGGDLLVIHAMRLRTSYLDDYLQVMEWHRRS